MKDNHGTITKVNRKDVTPVEMDIKIAELFNESRQNSKIRDAQLAMPTNKIPDLGWQFDEDIQLVEPIAKQIYSLKPIQEKAQNPMTPPIEEETVPVQPVKETATEAVPTEAVEIQAVQTSKIEECQIILQTPMVFRFLAVLKPVAATVTHNKQNSFLITESSSQSRHKQAVGKYITNLPMEINMKIFDFRFPSTYAVNNALISHLQIDYYTIHKIQSSNIKTKPPRREKKLKKVLYFSEYHCVHLISPRFLFLVIPAWNFQLGHPITTDLRQEFGITVTNNSQAFIYYRN